MYLERSNTITLNRVHVMFLKHFYTYKGESLRTLFIKNIKVKKLNVGAVILNFHCVALFPVHNFVHALLRKTERCQVKRRK